MSEKNLLYVVTYGNRFGYIIMGVYDSRKKAKKAIVTEESNSDVGVWHISRVKLNVPTEDQVLV